MKKRRFLSWLLAMTMVLTMFPAVTLAETITTAPTGTTTWNDGDVIGDNSTDYITINGTDKEDSPLEIKINGSVILKAEVLFTGYVKLVGITKDATILYEKALTSNGRSMLKPGSTSKDYNSSSTTFKDLTLKQSGSTDTPIVMSQYGHMILDNVTFDFWNFTEATDTIINACYGKLTLKNNVTFKNCSVVRHINMDPSTEGRTELPITLENFKTDTKDGIIMSYGVAKTNYNESDGTISGITDPIEFATGATEANKEHFVFKLAVNLGNNVIKYVTRNTYYAEGSLYTGSKAPERTKWEINLGTAPTNSEFSGNATQMVNIGSEMTAVTVTPSSGYTFTGVVITALQTELKNAGLEATVNTDGAIVIDGKPSADVNLSSFKWPIPVEAPKKVVLGTAEDLATKGLEVKSGNLSQEIGSDGTFTPVTIKAKDGKMSLTDEDVTAINKTLGANSPLIATLTNGEITISKKDDVDITTGITTNIATYLTVHNDIVAVIGSTSYDDLKTAIGAAKLNDTVVMKANPSSKVSGIALTSGAALKDTNSNTYKAMAESTKISVDTNGAVTLNSGKLEASGGSLIASIKNIGSKSFDGNGTKYTVDTEGSLTLGAGGSVKMDSNVTFTGKANDIFNLDKSTSGNTTATVPADASVTGKDNVKITGVTKGAETGANDTKVEIDANGALTLVAGKGKVTGKATFKVAVKDNDGNVTKTVDVTIPAGKTYTIDADALPPTVGTLAKGEQVTLGGITYTAGKNDTEFPIGTDKLVNTGDKAEVPAKTAANVTLGDDTGAPVITVPNTNTGATTITKGDESNPTTVQVPANGKFTLNKTDYAAGDQGATFVVNEATKTASLESGNAVVKKDGTLGVKTGDTFVPVKATDNDIVVKANDPEGKSSAIVPNGGFVTIGSDGNAKTYPSIEDGTEFVFDKDGNVTLTDGTTKLGNNKSIIGGGSDKEITNSGNDEITVQANYPTDGKDTVKVPTAGKVKIGDTEYDVISEATIVVGSDGSELTGGSVKLNPGEDINVGTVSVKNTADGDAEKDIIVSADPKTVTVPEGGQTDIGKAKITDIKQGTTFTIDEDGNAKVTLNEGETVTINGVVYTGGEGGGTITVDPKTGKVTGIKDSVNIAIDEANLTEGFSYELVPGQSVTIGKYVYTAPVSEDAAVGDVTITGRGIDKNGKALNPKVTLKKATGSVEVALSANKETKTTYTAENASTMFAMAANDTNTKNIELLDNGNPTANSKLKFTDKKSYSVNGVTYQAQTVKDAVTSEEKAVSYTVAYGTRIDENGETVSSNKVDVESGSKVIATMNYGDSININGRVGDNEFGKELPFIASNDGASIIIDSSSDKTNDVTANGSTLSEVKDEEGHITGYLVSANKRRRGGSGGSSSGSSSYTVSFETNGGSKVANQVVTYNTAMKEPTAPTKDGYDFAGWYTDKELTTKYDFSAKVAKSFTLYAAWSEAASENRFILTIGEKDAQVWGKTMTNDVAPQIVKDRTMLPARFVAENLGATVDWDEEKQLVTITGKNERQQTVTILITIGDEYAVVNGESVKLDSPAFVENDRTYTPIRFISERIGATVDWNETEQKVIITKLPLIEEK